MKKLFNLFGGHRPDAEALSAYLDRRLTANESAAVEAHVAACDACRTRLTGLQDVRATLRATPQAAAPRSFRVREADLESAPRAATPAAAPWIRALPAFGGLAAAVFVFSVAIDVQGGGTSGDEQTAAMRTLEMDASRPAGGIAADDGDQAYDDAGAPAPLAPDRGAPEAGTDGDAAGASAATSAVPPADDTELKPGAEAAPDVEAARDTSSSADDGGWPLSRYVAIVAAISALAALGAWLGLRFERRFS